MKYSKNQRWEHEEGLLMKSLFSLFSLNFNINTDVVFGRWWLESVKWRLEQHVAINVKYIHLELKKTDFILMQL